MAGLSWCPRNMFKKRAEEILCVQRLCLRNYLPSHVSCARSIPNCIRRRSLTLSCINLGMSHNMLFYIRSMIYMGIDCLQSCNLEKGFCFMAMMLNAKDVYPS